MNKEEFIKSINLNYFCHTLVTMRTRMFDRDNIDMLALQFDNFEEFYLKFKHLFLLNYKNEDRLFNAIFRIYLSGQLSYFAKDNIENNIISETVYEIVESHGETMKIALLKVWPKVYEEIINNNKKLSL